MSTLIETLQAAQKQAMAIRPKVGGFPYLAETLRQAGVKRNSWYLPSCQSIYVFESGSVVNQGTPLVEGMVEVPVFNQESLVTALRTDQAGESTFPEFLRATWLAGVTWYEVNFEERKVTYGGCNGEVYVEEYPTVAI